VRRRRGAAEPGEAIEHVVDQLGGWSRVEARRMFSGYGLFRDGLMFGLFVRDTLHFKTDDGNRGDYEAAGMAPFRYRRGGRTVALGYHAVPAEAVDDPDMLAAWAEKSFAAAARKAADARRRAARPGRRTARGR